MYVECAAWLPLAAAKKTLWAQAERDGWDTLPLLFKLTPWSIVVLSVLVPVIDPPGVMAFQFTDVGVALLLLSGIGAFLVNWSSQMVSRGRVRVLETRFLRVR